MLDRCHHVTYFLILNLKTAFCQILFQLCDIKKAAFNTKDQLFERKAMSTGLCCLPETSQRFIHCVLHNFIDQFLVVYIDYMLIYSNTAKESVGYISSALI